MCCKLETWLIFSIDSTWFQTALWKMHFGHTWHLRLATITISYVDFSQSSISTLQCVSTSTT